MTDLSNHFLDTNIFLSAVFSDNAGYISQDYFNLDASRFTSATVENESNNVISKMENLSFEIITCIDKYVSDNNIPDEKIKNYLYIIKNEFLDKYHLEDCPFGFKKEKFVKIVNNIFFRYSKIINQYFYLPFPIWVNEEYSNLDLSYKKYYSALKDLFKNIHIFTIDEKVSDEKFIRLFNGCGIHNPDARILLDAFKVSKKIGDILFFVTEDKRIINTSDIILSVFKNQIIPKMPDELINS